MKRTFIALALTLGAMSPAALAGLTNGDAEPGNLTGWTPDLSGATSGSATIIDAVKTQSQSTGVVHPYAGDWFFSFATAATRKSGDPAKTISMYQEGTDALGSPILTLSGWYQTEELDAGEGVLTIYDASNTVLDSVSTGELNASTWTPFEASLAVPGGADHWRVELYGTVNSTTFANVFYDNVSLVPVPGAVLLGATGLGVVGWLRRRGRKR